ncbi:monooxygenase [Psychrobacter lutiphocae]|uniref:monooxygenase n=1 Tax=Psychrobacter lutiphocae TaxID=540500 RepID=UPI000374C4AC|nr:monooxygenase [Psychrobacter lutiphocae]
MKYLLQIDFPFSGPFGDEFFTAMQDLAKDIATEPGLVSKIWTENQDTQEAGGIYVFDNLDDANRYLQKHTDRLQSFGITGINAKVFTINEELSAICHAKF